MCHLLRWVAHEEVSCCIGHTVSQDVAEARRALITSTRSRSRASSECNNILTSNSIVVPAVDSINMVFNRQEACRRWECAKYSHS
ncbi:hypothetical protein BAUCODRAFT_562568 [Baudoinia panamericana UAMH 10762]|uniref:Uncharacterized protein n=1 Tax=Baudoinia panamericana (strain UAMH 10762) TaxID=717646 RepID=M2MTE1_BAUPA|nr:uncharacterized protein BAUCODRAFT_562568 [Baudoinia panamericana UAMH 10762]EMC94803.1 hypothetical protein BAUCODRAFT_562568 [Baudoinia panamericana UAMH 10762]